MTFYDPDRRELRYARSHLLGTLGGGTLGGVNGPYLLNALTVHDDGHANDLEGGDGLAWFFSGMRDRLEHQRPGEIVTLIH